MKISRYSARWPHSEAWRCQTGMPAGIKIPKVEGGTYGIDPLSTAEGLSRLRRSLARLGSNEPVRFHSPAFGPMSDADRVQFNLRHAELHLGYLVY